MTVTAFFGDDDITLATSDIQEGADTCAITASSVNADLPISESGDSCTINTVGAVSDDLALSEGGDLCAIAVGSLITTTMDMSESGDGCLITGLSVNVQPPPPGSGRNKYKVHPPHPGRNIKVTS